MKTKRRPQRFKTKSKIHFTCCKAKRGERDIAEITAALWQWPDEIKIVAANELLVSGPRGEVEQKMEQILMLDDIPRGTQLTVI